MKQLDETAILLRNWLEAEGGDVNVGSLSDFIARYPLHKKHVQGRLSKFVAAFPQLFELVQNQDRSTTRLRLRNATAAVAREVGEAEDQALARALETYITSRGGVISCGELGIFYQLHNNGKKFRGSLSGFLARFPTRFRLSNGGRNLHLVEQQPAHQQRHQEHLAIQDALERFIRALPEQRLLVSRDLAKFYIQHPGMRFTGGIKKFCMRCHQRFVIEGACETIVLKNQSQQRPAPSAGCDNAAPASGSIMVPQVAPSYAPKVLRAKSVPSSNTQSQGQGHQSRSIAIDRPILTDRKRYEANQAGLKITPDPSQASMTGFIPSVPTAFSVRNDSQVSHRLSAIDVRDPRKNAKPTELEIENLSNLLQVEIHPGFTLQVNLKWKPECPKGQIRLHLCHVLFNFAAGVSISRFVAVEDGNGENARAFRIARPTVQYFRREPPAEPLRLSENDDVVFPRLRTPSQSLRIQLPTVQLIRGLDRSILYAPQLTHSTYELHFRTLLHANFECETKELELSDLFSVQPQSRYGIHGEALFFFPVPGLAEKRPSVLMGDKVICQDINTHVLSGGVVRVVEQNHVGVEFNAGMVSTMRRYNVRFLLNPFPFRMSHLALSCACRPEILVRLFDPLPQDDLLLASTAGYTLPFFRYREGVENLPLDTIPTFAKLNALQQTAVVSIVNCMPKTRLAPFLLFGPPGTGKTTTLVTAVVCLLGLKPHSKILVSAGSNSACDVFYQKLVAELGSARGIERYLAASRADVQQDVATLEAARVIISTCVTSGKLSGLKARAFTHVFVDEAGQCTEPESLIPLALMHHQVQMILGGDHRQLGPVIRDDFLCKVGRMDVSLFERLMRLKKYRDLLDSRFSVLLQQSYRSHPQLLKVPSMLFYQSKLHAVNANGSLARWSELPCSGFPMILHHVAGKEDREYTSPSWFNLAECDRVMHYIRLLDRYKYTFNPHLVMDRDVIVIAPYAGQVRKMRIFLREAGLSGVQADSVEKFQGGEARVVLITTARSSSMTDDYDSSYHVGFLKNEKRFNVAVTRARELLIVVGNVHVLKTDYHWSELVKHIATFRSVVGYEARE